MLQSCCDSSLRSGFLGLGEKRELGKECDRNVCLAAGGVAAETMKNHKRGFLFELYMIFSLL